VNSAWLFSACALAAGTAVHFIAASRAPNRDCGPFWAEVMDRLCVWLGLPLLLLACVQKSSFARHYLPSTSTGWLLAIAIGWLAVLGASLFIGKHRDGRWIAGTLEFSPHRFWILGFLLPFLPALFFSWNQWPEDIFAADWALLVTFLITLLGIALSASPAVVWVASDKGPADQQIALSPWPDEIRSRGVPLEYITSWEPAAAPEPAAGVAAEWQHRLAEAGSPNVSAVLCEAVSRLVWTPQKTDRLAVLVGPDWCGQEEVIALVATELSRRHGEATLVITSAPDPALARRLPGWLERLGGENPIQMANLSADASANPACDLLLTDAETLSESVLGQLRNQLQQDSAADVSGQSIGRIGLVVWWNAHEFSGVLAAHVWAVSRRLERLLKARRGPAARAIVYARPPADHEGLFLGYLEHLLPYPGMKENAFQIAPDFARKTHFYRLGSAAPDAAKEATEASLLTDWPTLPASEADLPAELTHRPAESAASAGARILELRPADVLSLRQMTCRGGRGTATGLEHHVAIARSDNPYLDFLVQRYGDQPERGASVNLVSAEGHPELVRRHLLIALREVPDTLTGLRSTFRWEEALLKGMLQQLSLENRLSRVPVRFLNDRGQLQRDSLYTNQNPGLDAVRSFRTIGQQRPVEVRDRNVRDRVVLQVDPERLPIDAYPKRVIEAHGRRYRILGWEPSPSRIECTPEPSQIRTWRFSTSRISSPQPFAGRLIFPGVARYLARVDYHEDVNGVLERHPDGAFHSIGLPRVRTSFRTEAVILEFMQQFQPDQLIAAAAALRHVLPVHMALDEDAMEVVPTMMEGRQGLALVELYPGGIGVANALHKMVWVIPMLFDQAAFWLSSVTGDQISSSPLMRTMGLDRLNVSGALKVFNSAGWQAR
jgi:hypothetical protein